LTKQQASRTRKYLQDQFRRLTGKTTEDTDNVQGMTQDGRQSPANIPTEAITLTKADIQKHGIKCHDSLNTYLRHSTNLGDVAIELDDISTMKRKTSKANDQQNPTQPDHMDSFEQDPPSAPPPLSLYHKDNGLK